MYGRAGGYSGYHSIPPPSSSTSPLSQPHHHRHHHHHIAGKCHCRSNVHAAAVSLLCENTDWGSTRAAFAVAAAYTWSGLQARQKYNIGTYAAVCGRVKRRTSAAAGREWNAAASTRVIVGGRGTEIGRVRIKDGGGAGAAGDRISPREPGVRRRRARQWRTRLPPGPRWCCVPAAKRGGYP